MSLRARIGWGALLLLVLAIAGEFVSAARRRVRRRRVPEATVPTIQTGQFVLWARGPDGWPVPQAAVAHFLPSSLKGAGGGTRQYSGLSSGLAILSPLERAGQARWVLVSRPVDTADAPLPWGAVLVGPIDPGASTVRVDLPEERVISGEIRRGASPLPGLRVKARMVLPPEVGAIQGSEENAWQDMAMTDSAGRFRLGRLGVGLHEIAIDGKTGYAFADRRMESGGVLDIDAEDVRAVTVTVLDVGGSPQGGAPVSALEPGAPPGTAARIRARGVTDGTGRIQFIGLDPAARYRLVVHRPGAGDAIPGEERDWTPSEATVRLPRIRGITVRVKTDTGAPHPGVAVTAVPVEPGRPGLSGVTARDGRCTFGGLDAGPVRVTVVDTCSLDTEASTQSKEIGDDEQGAVFTMAQGPSISVYAYGASGGMSEGAQTFLRATGSTEAAVRVVRESAALWHNADPAVAYEVIVLDRQRNQAGRADGLRASKAPLIAPAYVPMTPSLALPLRIDWPTGSTDRSVRALWGGAVIGTATERDPGFWVVPCVPKGKYVLRATCTVPGKKDPVTADVEVDAGIEAVLDMR